MSDIQIINKNGQPEWAVIPYEQYQKLVDDSEMLMDIKAYDEAKKAIIEGEEIIPSEVTFRILDGENALKVWREYRQLTQQQLADKAGISKAYLSQIESGKRKGTVEVLSSISETLKLTLEDIIDWSRTSQ